MICAACDTCRKWDISVWWGDSENRGNKKIKGKVIPTGFVPRWKSGRLLLKQSHGRIGADEEIILS